MPRDKQARAHDSHEHDDTHSHDTMDGTTASVAPEGREQEPTATNEAADADTASVKEVDATPQDAPQNTERASEGEGVKVIYVGNKGAYRDAETDTKFVKDQPTRVSEADAQRLVELGRGREVFVRADS